MKRLTIALGILMLTVVLSACGDLNVHDDVDEELAEDSWQMMVVVSKNVDKDIMYEDAESEDKNIVDSYYDKYAGEFSTLDGIFEGVDEDISIIANATVVKYKQGITLDTEKEDLEDSKDNMKEFIESGEGYDI